jgi:hypothetical protein
LQASTGAALKWIGVDPRAVSIGATVAVVAAGACVVGGCEALAAVGAVVAASDAVTVAIGGATTVFAGFVPKFSELF